MAELQKVDGLFIDFEGFQEFLRGLDQFPKKIKQSLLRKAMRPAYKIVEKEARVRVPKSDKRTLMKNLKVRSITFGRKRGASKGEIGVKVAMPPRDVLNIGPKDKGYYPAILEYGAPSRNIRPYAYLRKSHDNNLEKVFSFFEDKLGELIDQEAEKIRTM